MIWLAAAAMAAACAAGDCKDEGAAVPVAFEPRARREKAFESFGPVGPYYPAAAAQKGVTGFAILDCKVAEGGVLKSCTIVNESPRGENFGPAAMVLAMRKRIRAAEPYVVGERLKVRVPFELRP
jgi:TonB family protein